MSDIILIGESPGKGSTLANHSPLFPLPKSASGFRLKELMGLSLTQYTVLRRVNLIAKPMHGKWDKELAAWTAKGLLGGGLLRDSRCILLGQKVKEAFSLLSMEDFTWTRYDHIQVASIPHPSGLNRVWNDPEVKAKAERFFSELVQ